MTATRSADARRKAPPRRLFTKIDFKSLQRVTDLRRLDTESSQSLAANTGNPGEGEVQRLSAVTTDTYPYPASQSVLKVTLAAE